MNDGNQNLDTIELTTEIVSAYVANNSVAQDKLPELIQSVSSKLAELNGTGLKSTKRLEPVVSIQKSRTDNYITCLHCGKNFKSIKRHINASHNQTPEEYRQAFGLPADYGMVTSEYSGRRSKLAVENKLGRKPGKFKK